MPKYKLLALDIDGTLVNKKGKVTDTTTKWVRKADAAGVVVVLATGRAIQNTDPIRDHLGLHAPMVLLNGAEVWKSPGHLVTRQFLSPDGIYDLHRLAVQHDAWYWASSVHTLVGRSEWTDDMFQLDWMKFGMRHDDPEIISHIRDIVSGWNAFEVTSSHPLNMEVGPKGVTKASGMKRVCADLGMELHDVMAVGDSPNDHALIRRAGFGVVMENGDPAVKKDADALTKSNEENGVAYAIRRYLFDDASVTD